MWRIVIPSQNLEGEVVAHAGRWRGGLAYKDTLNYKLPSGFKKGLALFNANPAVTGPVDQPPVIVGGILNAIKLHQLG